MAMLVACGGDTIKLFDVSGEPERYACKLQYAPSPNMHVHCARWNHTNLVVASAGEDKKIHLWLKSGRPLGDLPTNGEAIDNIEETIMSINFSTKGSRYLCSGGTGKIVRIWDMQRRRCIKWMKGHTDTITGVIYNCKDEHLASINIQGDLILHNLASGSRVTELKDPYDQVLRVLDFSKLSRHLLVTAGDDGTVHAWDTTVRNPKASWINQHLAPTSGVCFSPCTDKMIVSVGLDKKLYTFDPGMKKPAFCISCEAPYSSLAFKDDGGTIVAGTNNGRVNFYDIRNKLQPYTVLRAYGSSEPVSSLSWQKSNPIVVDELNCSAEVALLGSAGEDSVLMPDPLPATFLGLRSHSVSSAMALGTFETSDSEGFTSSKSQFGERTPSDNHRWTNEKMSWLQMARSHSAGKDDMEVFSPIVDVQPITPSNPSQWDLISDLRNFKTGNEVSRTLVKSPPAGVGKAISAEEAKDEARQSLEGRLASHLGDFHVKSTATLSVPSTPMIYSKGDISPSVTPPEAWGGDGPSDPNSFRAHSLYSTSRFSSELPSISQAVLEREISTKYSTYRGQFGSSAGGVNSLVVGSTVSPSRKDLLDSTTQLRSFRGTTPTSVDGLYRRGEYERCDEHGTSADSSDLLKGEPNSRLGFTGGQPAPNGGPSFALQLVQRALEESLGSVQKAIHEDVQNLHLDLLRQFHLQQMEMTSMIENLKTRQADLMEEIQALRRENKQLRHF